MADEPYAPLYWQGIKLFNRGEYFDSHEVWEELWIEERGPDRRFYQGLIQAAVALFHLGNANLTGARKLMHGSAGYLAGYRPEHLGLDVNGFIEGVRACFEANQQSRSREAGDLVQRPTIRLARISHQHRRERS